MSDTSHDAQFQALAEFRYTLRKFLHFSEESATRVGLQPQQHQLLLQIAGAPMDAVISIGYLAGRLALRHHSVVELTKRCEEAALLLRKNDPRDGRIVVLTLTAAGRRMLRSLSDDHTRELNELGPRLTRALRTIAPRRDKA